MKKFCFLLLWVALNLYSCQSANEPQITDTFNIIGKWESSPTNIDEEMVYITLDFSQNGILYIETHTYIESAYECDYAEMFWYIDNDNTLWFIDPSISEEDEKDGCQRKFQPYITFINKNKFSFISYQGGIEFIFYRMP